MDSDNNTRSTEEEDAVVVSIFGGSWGRPVWHPSLGVDPEDDLDYGIEFDGEVFGEPRFLRVL